jgi:hypothetical protein
VVGNRATGNSPDYAVPPLAVVAPIGSAAAATCSHANLVY